MTTKPTLGDIREKVGLTKAMYSVAADGQSLDPQQQAAMVASLLDQSMGDSPAESVVRTIDMMLGQYASVVLKGEREGLPRSVVVVAFLQAGSLVAEAALNTLERDNDDNQS